MTDYKPDIPDRKFMQTLLKHTGIALAILIPLAAYTSLAHSETGEIVTSASSLNSEMRVSEPASVAQVDLHKYAGQWYEIARLPMPFQKNCASDVTATYTLNSDDAGNIKSVNVINQCKKENGDTLRAEGLAKPANDSGSELKVSFLPSWLRWLPVGKADYWVLGLSDNYESALVGTPDNKYLWVLSREPSLSKNVYTYYTDIAQSQGYDISALKLTPHTTPQSVSD